jgi:hypothetical protein
MNQFVYFQTTSLNKSFVANITYMILLTCMDQLVSFQVTDQGKSLVAHITYMFVAGHCSFLMTVGWMTVGWAWLGSRVCLAKMYFIFFNCLNNEKENSDIIGA